MKLNKKSPLLSSDCGSNFKGWLGILP